MLVFWRSGVLAGMVGLAVDAGRRKLRMLMQTDLQGKTPRTLLTFEEHSTDTSLAARILP